MAKQVKTTYILDDGGILYITFDNKYFVQTHLVGKTKQIN